MRLVGRALRELPARQPQVLDDAGGDGAARLDGLLHPGAFQPEANIENQIIVILPVCHNPA